MSRNVPGLTLNYVAAGAIAARRIVKHGAADGAALQATASTEAFLGVSTDIPAGSGERVDVYREGVVPVQYGGNVTRGDPLTSDADGKAVVAAPTAAALAQVIGYAEISGVANDIGSVHLSRNALRAAAA